MSSLLRRRPRRTTATAAIALVALAVLGASPALARGEPPPVFAPQAHPFGLTYGQWAAQWWRWGLSQPGAAPLVDASGAHCGDGQEGPVWFLAGSFAPGAVTRSCTVPAGKALLFPVVNDGAFAFPTDPADQRTEEFLRGQVDPPVRAATGLAATIDGVSVPDIKGRYFEDSVLFSVTVPGDNIFGLPGGTVVGPDADAGYYVMVRPLPPGGHEIHFTGTLPDFGLTVDVTDRITVRAG